MFFSIVIPTFERPKDLSICLEALEKISHNYSGLCEIIVADDSKSHKSQELVNQKFKGVIWVKGKQNGPAGNRNAGAEKASGKWIIFVDDDCIPQENFLQEYDKAILENPTVKIFEGKIFPDRPRRTWAEGCPENSSGGMLWTSNLCLQKDLFETVGGFDERFEIAYEDVEFAFRLKKLGYSTIFVTKASVCHPWRSLRTGGKNWKKKGYQIKSLLLFLDKHAEAWNEFGQPSLYFKNFLRIISKNLMYCIFSLKGRGIDLIFSQAYISLKASIILISMKFK